MRTDRFARETRGQGLRCSGGGGVSSLTHILDLGDDARSWAVIRPELLVDFLDELSDRPHIIGLSHEGRRDKVDVVLDPVAGNVTGRAPTVTDERSKKEKYKEEIRRR